jgi:hypothetical protein
MRHFCYGLTLAALTLLIGCNSTKWNLWRGTPAKENYRTSNDVPTREALVNYLNDNAERVQSIRCNQLDLQCSQGIRTVGLTGYMVCQKPRNFRLIARVFGKDEIDVGSNGDEFWFWIARGEPYQFHCSHRALEEGRVKRLPFPIQPDWIIEAMGLARYDATKAYQVLDKPNTVELVETTRSPQGAEILKVTEFRKGRAPEGQAQVTAHKILDKATGKIICSATITQVRVDRATGAVIPRKVILWCPDDKIKLTMSMDEVTVNGQVGQTDLLFQRRTLSGIRAYDLAEGRFDDGNPIRRVQGGMR